MAETQEINQILGELQQEIQNLRDSEVAKLVKPFVDKTEVLVNKIEGINFPERLDNIEEGLNEVNKNIEDFDNKIVKTDKDLKTILNKKFKEYDERFNKQNKLMFLIIVIGLVTIALTFVN